MTVRVSLSEPRSPFDQVDSHTHWQRHSDTGPGTQGLSQPRAGGALTVTATQWCHCDSQPENRDLNFKFKL